jgi:hypothetical protein
MTNNFICCEQFASNFAMRSPFGKIVSLGYYDGTTSGVAQCSHCLRSYRYELVAWDSGLDIRVYSLADLAKESFEAIIRLLSDIKSPTWPFWSPFLTAVSVRRRKKIFTAINNELAKADPPALAIASYQLDREILGGKSLTDIALEKVLKCSVYPDMRDWDFWRTYMELDSQQEFND